MLTYSTVGWIVWGLLMYGACIVGVFLIITRRDELSDLLKMEEERVREEKIRVADRMMEGRY